MVVNSGLGMAKLRYTVGMAKFLIADDDKELSTFVREYLEMEANMVDQAFDGQAAEDFLRSYSYDAAIIDWQMPGLSGPEVVQRFRQRGGTTPIIMLTAKDTTKDKTAGLDAGADDYLTKPFDLDELKARLRALLRRAPAYREDKLRIRDMEINFTTHEIEVTGQAVHLTPLEFSLLEFLVKHRGEIFSCEALLDRVWPARSEAGIDMVRSTVKRLRKKIGDDKDELIRNVYGVGYTMPQ